MLDQKIGSSQHPSMNKQTQDQMPNTKCMPISIKVKKIIESHLFVEGIQMKCILEIPKSLSR